MLTLEFGEKNIDLNCVVYGPFSEFSQEFLLDHSPSDTNRFE